MSGRRRRYTAHFLVHGLVMPEALRIGPATIRPVPAAARRIRRAAAGWPIDLVDEWPQFFEAPGVAILEIDGTTREYDLASVRIALRETARDVIAVFRLFQRDHFSINVEQQPFGLVEEVPSYGDISFLTDRTGMRQGSASRLGALGPFTFRRSHLSAFRRDPRFSYLRAALSVPAADRSDWQRRVIRAVRMVHAAQEAFRTPTRIVLYATALEALLGRKGRGGSHSIGKRAAFLTCHGEGLPPHGPARGPCPYLEAHDADELIRVRKASPIYCWAYEHPLEIYRDRNSVLHEASEDFAGSVQHYQQRVDDLILAAIAWIRSIDATRIADLDLAIRRVTSQHVVAGG